MLLPALVLQACALLTSAEIRKVQGSSLTQVQPSTRRDGDLDVQQCFYRLADAARSVSLEVRRPAAGAPERALEDRWEKMQETDGEPGEPRAAPMRVKGIGSRALWVGNAKAGALYVLSRRGIVRVSVGGPGEERLKLARCKSLARRVLRRL